MAIGTALLILTFVPEAGKVSGLGCFGWPLMVCGRLSYEIYLFHLVVLGGLRSVFLPEAVSSDGRLIILMAYLVGSIGLAAGIGRFYAETLNWAIRRGLPGWVAE